MKIVAQRTPIDEVVVLTPEVFKDHRGFFLEVFREDQYQELGIPTQFVQFNHSGSTKNTIRGLHFQWQPPMGKLMRVSRGSAFLVAVDVRKSSPTLGRWFGTVFSEEDRRLLWAPAGCARGFGVLSDFAEIEYLTTGTYNPAGESGILWNDPEIGIDWPVSDPVISTKDASAQTLAEWLQQPDSNNF
jgi:dTDP-4-dehydrorhamnose 3,5-epimerase